MDNKEEKILPIHMGLRIKYKIIKCKNKDFLNKTCELDIAQWDDGTALDCIKIYNVVTGCQPYFQRLFGDFHNLVSWMKEQEIEVKLDKEWALKNIAYLTHEIENFKELYFLTDDDVKEYLK